MTEPRYMLQILTSSIEQSEEEIFQTGDEEYTINCKFMEKESFRTININYNNHHESILKKTLCGLI